MAERVLPLAMEWVVRTRGADSRADVWRRRVGRSGCLFLAGFNIGGLFSEGGSWCCLENVRSSSKALLCQWKAVRESRAAKDSGRWREGWDVLRK